MYTAKVAVGHVASFDPGASQMKISVAIELYGSYDPVETPKPLWGSPGAELSTWTTFQFCCETAIHGHALRHGPPELYSAIQRYTLYSYTAIQRYTLYNLYNTPLLTPNSNTKVRYTGDDETPLRPRDSTLWRC